MSDIIDVTYWDLVENSAGGALYPEGALEKYRLRNSNGEYFMFKNTWVRVQDEEPHQFWSEILSARIALAINIPIPETYIGVNSDFQKIPFEVGTLSKWFYDSDLDNYIKGSEWLNVFVANYTEEKHNLSDVLESCADTIDNAAEFWLKLLVFDALIGNADRHHENWGIINGSQFAPAFDNGISLAWREKEENFEGFNHAQYFNKFKHKIKIRAEDSGKAVKFKNILIFLKTKCSVDTFNHVREVLQQVSNNDINDLILNTCAQNNTYLPEKYRMTDIRANFIVQFICNRKEFIIGTLDDIISN